MKNLKLDITEKAISPLPFAEKGNYVVRDIQLKGFTVIIGKRTKTYVAQGEYWRNNQRQFALKTKIGEFGAITVRDARTQAKEILALIAKGQNPGEEKAEETAVSVTLMQAWNRYKEAYLERKGRSAKTVKEYRDHVERLFNDWHDKPLAELSNDPVLVAKKHDSLTKHNGPYMANSAMRTLRAIYNHARKTSRDLPRDNPVDAVDWNNEERRNTGMADDQLLNWLMELYKLDNPLRREMHLFILLSGSRPTAIKSARIENIDFCKRTLHIPNPKGGEKKAFDIPLSREMIRSLIRTIRLARIANGDDYPEWLYPADSESGHITEHKEDRKILSKWGNELRQTYRNLGVVAGVDHLNMHLLMNHSLPGVNAGYITRSQLTGTTLRKAQQSISDVVMLEARKDKTGSLIEWLWSREIQLTAKEKIKS